MIDLKEALSILVRLTRLPWVSVSFSPFNNGLVPFTSPLLLQILGTKPMIFLWHLHWRGCIDPHNNFYMSFPKPQASLSSFFHFILGLNWEHPVFGHPPSGYPAFLTSTLKGHTSLWIINCWILKKPIYTENQYPHNCWLPNQNKLDVQKAGCPLAGFSKGWISKRLDFQKDGCPLAGCPPVVCLQT